MRVGDPTLYDMDPVQGINDLLLFHFLHSLKAYNMRILFPIALVSSLFSYPLNAFQTFFDEHYQKWVYVPENETEEKIVKKWLETKKMTIAPEGIPVTAYCLPEFYKNYPEEFFEYRERAYDNICLYYLNGCCTDEHCKYEHLENPDDEDQLRGIPRCSDCQAYGHISLFCPF